MTPTLSPIEPVERLMVVVGLRALISREVEKFKRSHAREFDDLPKEVSKLAHKLLDNDLTPGGTSDFSYRGMLKDLAVGWDPEQVVEMMAAFPQEMLVYTSALVLKTKHVVDSLHTHFPQTNYITVTGSTNLVPADKKIFKFVQVLEVLCDPLSVFSMMADGSLLQSQVKAVREVYPTLSTAIDAAILEATIKAKAKSKAFELSPLAEIGVRAWFGKGPIPTESLRKAQAAVDRSNERNQSQPSPTANVNPTQQTQTQRVEAQS